MGKSVFDIKKGWLAVVICLVLVFSAAGGLATETARADDGDGWWDPDLVERFVDEEGREVITVSVPGRPPEVKAEVVQVPESNIAMGTNTLGNVPAFDWCHGCSATSAAMLCGYYDRTSYPNMYAGPANGGVCPLNNATTWGANHCPLSATQQWYDGLTVRGHVDDYYGTYMTTVDPYWGNWAQHGYADCTADFMGTNQWNNWNNVNGATSFRYWASGNPYNDCPDGPSFRDGCHGLKLFVESRGYTVTSNYNQLIPYSIAGNGATGFSFEQYKAQINAGRPVLIHVEGHTMLGTGYNDTGTLVYLHDTWSHTQHSMAWRGDYQGDPAYTHYACSVIELGPGAAPPATPTLTSPPNGCNVAQTYVNCWWDFVAGADKYFLEVNSSSGWGAGTRLYYANVGNVQTKQVWPLPNNGTTYYWRAMAGNATGWSSWSSSRNFINGYSPPSAPTLTSPPNGCSIPQTYVNCYWDSVAGANKYFLEVNTDPAWGAGTRHYFANVGNVQNKQVTGFPNIGTTYYWRAMAGNDAGWSSWSSSRNFINGTIPGTPTLTSPPNGCNVAQTYVNCWWDFVAGANKYYLEVNTNPAWGAGTRHYYANVGNVQNKQVTGLPNIGTTYYWRVMAGNNAGWSSWSSSRNFINGYPPPTLTSPPNGCNVAQTYVNCWWDFVPGANKYCLEVNTNPAWGAGTRHYFANVGNVQNKQVTGLPNIGTTYYWRVMAGGGGGWGAWSSGRSFINGP